MTFPPDLTVSPQPWLWKPRVQPIRFLEIHATRGSGSPESQFQATVNWMQSPNNRAVINGVPQDWGGACSYIIGRDGKLGKVLTDDRYPTYNAGYGSVIAGGWSIDEYGIGYEWCQSANQEEYTTEQYERGAIEYAGKCQRYGVPVAMLNIERQMGTVPAGFVRHDRCENGAKLGKTDPGPKFRDADFIALVMEKMGAGSEEHMGLDQDQDNKLDTVFQKANENEKMMQEVIKKLDALDAKINALETAGTTHEVTVKHV